MKTLSILCFTTALLLSPSSASAQFGNLFGSSVDIENIGVHEVKKKLAERRETIKSAKAQGEDPPEADFVVVDVRSPQEVNVSVIPGAVTKEQFEKNREKYKEKTVIPYCTIGGRSARYAAQLVKDGYDVKNFKGSILKWVQEELPLVTLEGEPTKRVYLDSKRYEVPSQYQPTTR